MVESLGVPRGQEVTFARFGAWFARHQATHRLLDAHTLYEEIRGVLTGAPTGPLSLETYLALGVRQSLYSAEERASVHALFLKYREWLNTDNLHDPNLAAFARLPLATPIYEALVVDEVQDITPVQLALLTRLLRNPSGLLLCGDANQVVHPNFFSWTAVRGLFREQGEQHQVVSVLSANYRNARAITRVANRLLALRAARFGSIDRESSVPAEARTIQNGRIETLSADPEVLARLNEAVRRNVDFAVIVLRDEDKAGAAEVFGTPLIFSAQEAKGLEYQGVILYNVISGQRQVYTEIAGDLTPEDLDSEATFNRAGDKSDKSGERYKFHLNALYVALTRGISEVIVVEHDAAHPLLQLLGLTDAGNQVHVQARTSTARDWADEARKLQAQGKAEQAEAIIQDVLTFRSVPWEVLDEDGYEKLAGLALDDPGREKDRRAFLEYSVWHQQLQPLFAMTSAYVPYEPAQLLMIDAQRRTRTHMALRDRHLADYGKRNFKSILWETDLYGIDHRTRLNATPLMLAAAAGNVILLNELLERGADPDLTDHFGQTALMYALGRAMIDDDYASGAFDLIYNRLVPEFIDVQVEGKLLRLTRGQPEYAVLLRMLATMKSMMYSSEFPDKRTGITAADLTLGIQWDETPSGLNLSEEDVLAALKRGEVSSPQPGNQKLWVLQQTLDADKDTYLPNPDLYLRVQRDQERVWVPIAEAAGWYYMTLPETFEFRKPAAVLDFAPKRHAGTVLPRRTPDPATEYEPYIDSLHTMTGTVFRVFLGLLQQQQGVDPASAHQPAFADLEAALPRAFEALVTVRLAIADDHGHLSALLDDGANVNVAGALTALNDVTLSAVIEWQAWRQPEYDYNVLKELDAHGFVWLANTFRSGSPETRIPRGAVSFRSPYFSARISDIPRRTRLDWDGFIPAQELTTPENDLMTRNLASLENDASDSSGPASPVQSEAVRSPDELETFLKSAERLNVAQLLPGDAEIPGISAFVNHHSPTYPSTGRLATFGRPASVSQEAVDTLKEARQSTRPEQVTLAVFNDSTQSLEFRSGPDVDLITAEIEGPSDFNGPVEPLSQEQRTLLLLHWWTSVDEPTKTAGTHRRVFSLANHRLEDIVRHTVGLALTVYPHDGKPLDVQLI